ncbi:hypothetical protein [Duganella sp. S19_KUP01_CR8]|uniref:hypothetical protein n=1 Tax=Duganella sp. S19_KUP01_CR8 TaxID=3025502 RepID=UPI002FCD6FC1
MDLASRPASRHAAESKTNELKNTMQQPPFQLSTRQKIHVSLLYHFASLDYLQGLQQRLRALMASIDPTLDLAKLQQRDEILTDARWDTRNTSENWGNNGWPFLADFELSVATHIAKRAYEVYSITGANQCGRGMAEISLDWMTPDEQSDFEVRFEELSVYAGNIDDTMNQTEDTGRWDDFSLALGSKEFPEALAQAPALRLRADVTARTGMVPARTGVYIPIDDPRGTPQFCWTGKPAGRLLACSTFNDLGLEALAEVNPADLWINEDRMHAFVQDHISDPRLTCDPLFTRSIAKAKLAPSLVARNAFTSRPCTWIFVEQIHDEMRIEAHTSGIQP